MAEIWDCFQNLGISGSDLGVPGSDLGVPGRDLGSLALGTPRDPFPIPSLPFPCRSQEDFDSEQLSVLASCLQELFKAHFRGEVLPEEITEE